MCYRPLQCFENPEGGRPLFGFEPEKLGYKPMTLPCGKCYECKRDHVKSWACRGHYEMLRWPVSLFVTLTYDDKNLPFMSSLKKRDVQLFLKRLKKKLKSCKENPIRQIYCGEYGDGTGRPHYHLILFNTDFADAKLVRQEGYKRIYTSKTLTKLWGKGKVEYALANPSTIAYVVGYVHKKLSKRDNESRYAMDHDGAVYPIEPEFIEPSRNPGIGSNLRGSNSLKKGYITALGQKYKLPKYFMNWLKIHDPKIFLEISQNRDNSVTQSGSQHKINKQKEEYYEALCNHGSKSKRSPSHNSS